MIVVRIMGGLGNQMFQYALGRRLALERDVPLKLDLSWFSAQSKRSYRLDQFQISAQIATPADIRLFTKSNWPSFSRKIFKRLQEKYPQWLGQIVTHQSLSYCPQALEVPKQGYLKGYWQSEKYFINIRSNLLSELKINETMDPENQRSMDEICNTNSVSLHIRRGDYVNDPHTHQMHGVLPLDYYLHAMQNLENTVGSPHYFVFSDDLPWARQNIASGKKVTFMDHNDPKHEQLDFSLMCACKHHITANSSFSWWAAWLNDHPYKIVTAPRKWFADETMDSRDLIPHDWIVI